jgi:hypothetical protein
MHVLTVCQPCSDCTRSSVPFYLGHSRLQPLFEQGLLDCACYDAEAGGPLVLEYSKQTIDLGTFHQNLIPS